MDTAIARRRLEEMRAGLVESRTTLENEHAGDDSSELSHIDQHPADVAIEVSDADRQEAVLETLAGQLTEVDAALKRIDEGTYGTCVDCGAVLSDDRLDARPEAARCLADQERTENVR